MGNRTAAVILSGGLGLFALVAYHLTDWSALGSSIAFLGALGSGASIVAILYALFQLRQIRNESELIRQTTMATRSKISELGQYGNLAKAIALIQDAQGYARQAKHEIALLRLQDVKIIIGQVTVTTDDKDGKLASCIRELNWLLSSIEKEIGAASKSLVVHDLNKALETISDRLVIIQTSVLHKG